MLGKKFFLFFTLFALLLPTYLSIELSATAVKAQSGQRRPTERKKKQEQGQENSEEVQELDKKGETIKIETNIVSVDIAVQDKKTGGIYQGLKPGNFLIFEDGVKQEITNFAPTEAPVTMVLLLEYSRQISFIRSEVINPAAQFVTQFVKPKDQIAIVAYDIRPKVLNDFTDNAGALSGSVSLLIRNTPSFSESNLFDALAFVIDGGKLEGEEYGGVKEVQGHTAILLVSLGIDTFSKITYDKALKIAERGGVPIYSIGIGNLFFKINEGRMSAEQRLDFLQAGNQLRSLSETSGGAYFPVTFQGELPSTLKTISLLLRSQYSLGYTPTNTRKEGKRRKIEIQVDVNGDGKADNDKLVLRYRKGYRESDN